MKKIFKTMFAVAALAIGTFLFSGADAEAAATFTANIEQTEQKTTRIEMKWDPYISADTVGHYHILYSTDGITFGYSGYANGTTYTMYDLAPGKKYYVKVCAMSNDVYHWEHGDTIAEQDILAESEMVEVATQPEVSTPSNLIQTVAKDNQISLKWDAVEGATYYSVYRKNSYTDYTKMGDVATNKCTIEGLTNSYAAAYVVTATTEVVTNEGKNVVSATSSYSSAITAKTLPAQTLGVSITNYYDNIAIAYYGWSVTPNCDGYQFQLLNTSGKKIANTYVSGNSIRLDPYKKGVFLKARVRAYVNVDGEKKFGEWSSNYYSASSKKIEVRRSANRKKIMLSWKKISGVSQYDVYVSTRQSTGFKKVKSVSGSKSSCTITKYGKKALNKNKTYYIRVKYIGKDGAKKYTSTIVGTGSI